MEMHPAYQAALTGAVYYPISEPGTLRVRGEDRLAFFQRQTTYNVLRLSAGRTLVTVLTSPVARILDVLRLIDGGDSLIVLTLPGQSGATARFLKSRIFFNDKVSIDDLSGEYAQVDLEGKGAAAYLSKLGFSSTPILDEIASAQLGTNEVWAVEQRGLTGSGYQLILPSSSVAVLENLLHQLGVIPLPPQIYHVLRLEAGLPAQRAELTEAFTPLETGLDWAIADDKGCYTGQEVIARQVTYDKVTQHLVGLRLSTPAQPGEQVWFDGKLVGEITSAARSPRYGEIALAILKRPSHEAGTPVQIGRSGQPTTTAIVSSLPLE